MTGSVNTVSGAIDIYTSMYAICSLASLSFNFTPVKLADESPRNGFSTHHTERIFEGNSM